MKIKKGDTVLIRAGKDRGRKAKVLKCLPREGRVLVEGINIKKMHKRPKKEGEKGQVVEVPFPMDSSKIELICPKCSEPARIGFKVVEKKKLRVCRKCGAEI